MPQHPHEQLLEECAVSATLHHQNSWWASSSYHQEVLGNPHSAATNADTEPLWGSMDQFAASSLFDSWTRKNALLRQPKEVVLQLSEPLPKVTHNQHVVCHPWCAISQEHASELQRVQSFWPNWQSAMHPSGYPPTRHNEFWARWSLIRPPPNCRRFHLIDPPAQKSCKLHHQWLPLWAFHQAVERLLEQCLTLAQSLSWNSTRHQLYSTYSQPNWNMLDHAETVNQQITVFLL